MTSTQQKVLVSANPETGEVVVRQGLVDIGFILDPWPDTEAEVEAQAFAKVSPVDDDASNHPIPPNIKHEAIEL